VTSEQKHAHVAEPWRISPRLRWYLARARGMSVDELVWRARDQARRGTWLRRRVHRGETVAPVQPGHARPFPTTLDPSTASSVPAPARAALLVTADRLLDGHWDVLGVERHDLGDPDWFLDPISGRRAPSERHAFRIQHRSEAETGNVKQVWELSRHQHVTVLAAAYFVSGDDRYASRADQHLRSWWDENPFLTGIHWTSGIEVALRLVAWTWTRRLLDSWPGVADLFERNEVAVRQLFWHQQYLAGFRSAGSSANNHAIAEAAGRLVAACAFPWFDESARWRADAARLLERELEHNTFPSGVNRELASEYHAFVAELGFVAALEAEAAGVVLRPQTWQWLCRMSDAGAALLDAAQRPPRQGDGDGGIALRVDGAGGETSAPFLGLGAAVFGALPWWPPAEATVVSTVVGSLVRERRCIPGRPGHAPAQFPDAGITLLRTATTGVDGATEIWCRCDGGPHGFLATAAHAHADALSIEVRHDGVDILADPGTYCYHGEPEWRSYFRSTRAHNTIELAGRDQSRSGGPFLWVRPAQTRVISVQPGADGAIVAWCAEHDGYRTLEPAAGHRRTVRLDPEGRRLLVVDHIDTTGTHDLALHFHVGPTVDAVLRESDAQLTWPARHRRSTPCRATLRLPGELRWTAHRGETDPIRGWYSPSFGSKAPSVTLAGVGTCTRRVVELRTELEFHD
jgi:Heparinase II/III-like protein/Heparinase II/III N-terminus